MLIFSTEICTSFGTYLASSFNDPLPPLPLREGTEFERADPATGGERDVMNLFNKNNFLKSLMGSNTSEMPVQVK